MNALFFAVLIAYAAAMLLQFVAASFKKEKVGALAFWLFAAAFAGHTVYLVVRGIVAGRLPMSNQFEFAATFAWAVALLLLILRLRLHAAWLSTALLPTVFLILSYAALQPREITELMPALRSTWFGIHIGSAAVSYAAFVAAGGAGLRCLLLWKREGGETARIRQTDRLAYRMIALGFLLLTVTILSGAIWAEQAWSSFWTWDPKEVWALITWIVYAVYFHLRLRQRKSPRVLSWYAVLAVPVVIFTFIGVNTLMPGLHSYG